MVVLGGDGGSSARVIEVRTVETRRQRSARSERGGIGGGMCISHFFGGALGEVNCVDGEVAVSCRPFRATQWASSSGRFRRDLSWMKRRKVDKPSGMEVMDSQHRPNFLILSRFFTRSYVILAKWLRFTIRHGTYFRRHRSDHHAGTAVLCGR